MTLRLLLSSLLLLVGVSWAEQPPPQFEEFAISGETSVQRAAPVRIVDAQSRRYRTELQEAAERKPDFAGHYVLASWGCGASCVMAAAIDAKTGTVTRLPFTVSDWPLAVMEPLEYRLGSRLLVVRGSRNEKGNGTYYYELVGNSFKLVREVDVKP